MEYNVTNDISLSLINHHFQLLMVSMITPFNIVIQKVTSHTSDDTTGGKIH